MADLYTLAIDPGIKTIGACFFKGRVPVAAMATKIGKSPLDRHGDVARLVRGVFKWYFHQTQVPPDVVACEMPEHFGSAVGMAAAARGDVVWLGFCVGFVAAVAGDAGSAFREFPVHEWKGNMSKQMTAKRIKRKLEKVGVDWRLLLSREVSHDWDACGVGLHSLGLEL